MNGPPQAGVPFPTVPTGLANAALRRPKGKPPPKRTAPPMQRSQHTGPAKKPGVHVSRNQAVSMGGMDRGGDMARRTRSRSPPSKPLPTIGQPRGRHGSSPPKGHDRPRTPSPGTSAVPQSAARHANTSGIDGGGGDGVVEARSGGVVGGSKPKPPPPPGFHPDHALRSTLPTLADRRATNAGDDPSSKRQSGARSVPAPAQPPPGFRAETPEKPRHLMVAGRPHEDAGARRPPKRLSAPVVPPVGHGTATAGPTSTSCTAGGAKPVGAVPPGLQTSPMKKPRQAVQARSHDRRRRRSSVTSQTRGRRRSSGGSKGARGRKRSRGRSNHNQATNRNGQRRKSSVGSCGTASRKHSVGAKPSAPARVVNGGAPGVHGARPHRASGARRRRRSSQTSPYAAQAPALSSQQNGARRSRRGSTEPVQRKSVERPVAAPAAASNATSQHHTPQFSVTRVDSAAMLLATAPHHQATAHDASSFHRPPTEAHSTITQRSAPGPPLQERSARDHGAIYAWAEFVPKRFVCPLTKLVMTDPVINMEGGV